MARASATPERPVHTKRRPNIVWAPHPGSQTLFLSCPYFEVLYEGSRGPGKTDALLMDFAQHVGQGYGSDWTGVIFRCEYKDLQDLIKKSKKWFRQVFPSARFLENPGDLKWKFSTGEELLFRAAKRPDDYWSYHGHEYLFIGWEELCSWPDLTLYHMMQSCCRSSNPDAPRKYRATANPYGVGHNAVKAYFIDPAPPCQPIYDDQGNARVRIRGYLSENTHLTEADPLYLQRLQSETDPNRRKAWLEGDWDIVAGGAIDDVWGPARHVINPFPIPASWRIDRAFDWGSSHPFAVGWFAESDGTDIIWYDGTKHSTIRGDLFLIAEWYGWNGQPNEGCRMLAREIAQGIKEREQANRWRVEPGPADTQIFDVVNGHCLADDMAQVGIHWTEADKTSGSRVLGLQELRTRLKQTGTDRPGLYIFESCRHWLRTVPTLPRDEKKPDDIDTDAEDHCLVGSTEIHTPHGRYPISALEKTQGILQTLGGWIAFDNCRKTRERAEVIELVCDDQHVLRCTPDHLVLDASGTPMPAADAQTLLLQPEDIPAWMWSSLVQPSNGLMDPCIGSVDSISNGKGYAFIESSGKPIMDLFQKNMPSIISIMIARIMESRTWPWFPFHPMPVTTAGSVTIPMPSRALKKPLSNGIKAMWEGHGIKPNTNSDVNTSCIGKNEKYVNSAKQSIMDAVSTSFVRTFAKARGDVPKATIMSQNLVKSVDDSLQETDTGILSRVLDHVAGDLRSTTVRTKRRLENQDTYCLTIPGFPWFLVNGGLVVHNCVDMTRYRLLSKQAPMRKVKLQGL